MFKIVTSVFDLDDLEFLRVNGLALRHVELEKGLDEQKNGSGRGDAVSLANYGLNEAFSSFSHSISDENCVTLQKEIEHFIFNSLQHYHCPSNHFKDAAFHLMLRGDDARVPYDFKSYPLGKCGTHAFSAAQIVFSIFTNNYQNEDIHHATMQIFLEFKDKLRQLKIQKAHEWLSLAKQNETKESAKLVALLSKLIEVYSENIYLDKPLFRLVDNLVKQPQYALHDIEGLERILSNLSSEKKGESTLVYSYEEDNWDEMDEPTLKSRLLHYVANQNLPKVEMCLSRLPKRAFTTIDRTMGCPLQIAASLPCTAILKAIYEFDPGYYDLLMSDETLSTPIYLSFRTAQYGNTDFLLSKRQVLSRDLSCFNAHIFGNPPQFSERFFQVLDRLLEQGATLGNEIKGLHNNPFAIWMRQLGYSNVDPATLLKRLLPHTDYHSKYLGLLSCSLELYYLCNQSTTELTLDSNVEAFLRLRAAIFESLSLEECKHINELVSTKCYAGNAEERLYNDLAQSAMSSEQAKKFQLCFNPQAAEAEKQNFQITNPNRLWYTLSQPQTTNVEAYQVEDDQDDIVDSGTSIPCILM